MARTLVQAAGGIVLRREDPARIAVVRLRKRNEWVLPKGKLDDGETPRAAAEREVLEETGHDVSVHEFLGTLVYESGGRAKVVHYWRMEAGGDQVHELMHDVKAVDWLPLGDARRTALAQLRAGVPRKCRTAGGAGGGPCARDAAVEALEAEMPRLASHGARRALRKCQCPRCSRDVESGYCATAGSSAPNVMHRIQGWLRRVIRPDRAAASDR